MDLFCGGGVAARDSARYDPFPVVEGRPRQPGGQSEDGIGINRIRGLTVLLICGENCPSGAEKNLELLLTFSGIVIENSVERLTL